MHRFNLWFGILVVVSVLFLTLLAVLLFSPYKAWMYVLVIPLLVGWLLVALKTLNEAEKKRNAEVDSRRRPPIFPGPKD